MELKPYEPGENPDIDNRKRFEMLGLMVISLFSPDGRFLNHVKKIRSFISDLVEKVGLEGPNDDNIDTLKKLESLIDYYIEAENLSKFMAKLQETLMKSNMDHQEGIDFHLKTYQWVNKYPQIISQILKDFESDDSYKEYSLFLSSVSHLYYRAMEESSEIAEYIETVIEDIEKDEDRNFLLKFLCNYYVH